MRWTGAPGWIVIFQFGDAGEVVSLSIELDASVADAATEITKTNVCRLPLPMLERTAREHFAWWRTEYLRSRPPGVVELDEQARELASQRRRLGLPAEAEQPTHPIERLDAEFRRHERHPAAHSELWYAQLASAYVAAHNGPGRGRENEYLAERFGAVSHHTIRNEIRRARSEFGMLTTTQRGRAGGKLTPKAIQLLHESGTSGLSAW
jgi:hypothetical protein